MTVDPSVRFRGACDVHQFADSFDDKVRLIELDPVAAPLRNDVTPHATLLPVVGAPPCVPAAGRCWRSPQPPPRAAVIGSNRCDIAFERRQVVSHGSKAFRLTPVCLDDGMDVRRQLPHFADEALKGSRSRRAGIFYQPPRCTRRAAGQERQARAHHADLRQMDAEPRQVDAARYHPRALPDDCQPFSGWVHQHKAGDTLGMMRRIGANDEATEGSGPPDRHGRDGRHTN